MKIRYKLSLLIIGLMLIGCLYITQSYALWVVKEEQTKENEVEVGCFSVGFSEQSESINLNNTYPMSDSLGLSSEPYTFTITNTCTINNSYVLTLNTLSTNTLDVSKIKYALYKSTEAKPEVGSKLSRINTDLENLRVENLGSSYILDIGVLSGGTKVDGEVSNGEEVTYNLYLWIDDSAGNEVEGQTFEASINVVSAATESNEIGEVFGSEVAKCGAGGKDAVTCMKENASLDTINLAYDGKEILGEELGTNDNNLRYIGANPNNYVSFNNEIWRVIGVMNNLRSEQADGSETIGSHLKIIRQDGIEGQIDFGNYSWDYKNNDGFNDWTTSKLKDMLNGIYYEKGTGECYRGGSVSECDFNSGIELPKGLDNRARSMIDKDISWSLGQNDDNVSLNSSKYYEKEHNIVENGNGNPLEWTNNDSNHNGIALMYPSDYGYAVGEVTRKSCLSMNIDNFSDKTCYEHNWLKNTKNDSWLLLSAYNYNNLAYSIYANGNINLHYVSSPYGVEPVAYLKSNVKIVNGSGTLDNPFVLEN